MSARFTLNCDFMLKNIEKLQIFKDFDYINTEFNQF